MGYSDIFTKMTDDDKEPKRPNNNPSAALIANTQNGGVIVCTKPGCDLYYEVHEVGSVRLDDYGLDNAPEGITVWEGNGTWQPGGYEYPQDGTMWYEGTFRRLTNEELTKVQKGENLWPPLEHYLDGDPEDGDMSGV